MEKKTDNLITYVDKLENITRRLLYDVQDIL